MRPYLTHTLRLGEDRVLAHRPHEYFALIDVESYVPFVGKEVDHLDMVAHLATQMRALTAVAWGTPDEAVDLRFLVTEDDRAAEHVAASFHSTTASGWVRTNGRLCLTSHDRLYDCAHHRTHDVLRDERLPKIDRPHVLNVPPGVYSVLIYYHFPFPPGGDAATKVHYTVILRHYAFPAPRVAPVRLPGLVPQVA